MDAAEIQKAVPKLPEKEWEATSLFFAAAFFFCLLTIHISDLLLSGLISPQIPIKT